jgi:hypothetical protein
MQKTRLNEQLQGTQRSHHAQIVHHEKAIHTNAISSEREAARGEQIAVHVKVRQTATVWMKFINCLESERISQYDLPVGRARAQNTIAHVQRGHGRRALDYDTVGLLVAYAQLTQYAQTFNVKVIDEITKST